jgi:protein-S-isoprenylcysteine O-methyltransferase Ste14
MALTPALRRWYGPNNCEHHLRRGGNKSRLAASAQMMKMSVGKSALIIVGRPRKWSQEVTMKHAVELFLRIALLAFAWILWWWALNAPLSNVMNLSIIVGGVLLVFPLVWLGRKILDRHLTASDVAWITTFVQFAVGSLFGVAIIRAVITHRDWSGWTLPLPAEIGLSLAIITGAAFLLTVVNLALKGFGAPFFIALSRKLAADWLYAWARNPMVLAGLAFLLSLGIWFQSALFVLWVLMLFAPALLFFVKVYEERELEFRFGAPYLEYKSRTPMLFPRKPKG